MNHQTHPTGPPIATAGHVLVAAVLALAVTGGLRARQETCVWSNPAGGWWEESGNWVPSNSPISLDHAVLDVPGAGQYTVSLCQWLPGGCSAASDLSLTVAGSDDVTLDLHDEFCSITTEVAVEPSSSLTLTNVLPGPFQLSPRLEAATCSIDAGGELYVQGFGPTMDVGGSMFIDGLLSITSGEVSSGGIPYVGWSTETSVIVTGPSSAWIIDAGLFMAGGTMLVSDGAQVECDHVLLTWCPEQFADTGGPEGGIVLPELVVEGDGSLLHLLGSGSDCDVPAASLVIGANNDARVEVGDGSTLRADAGVFLRSSNGSTLVMNGGTLLTPWLIVEPDMMEGPVVDAIEFNSGMIEIDGGMLDLGVQALVLRTPVSSPWESRLKLVNGAGGQTGPLTVESMVRLELGCGLGGGPNATLDTGNAVVVGDVLVCQSSIWSAGTIDLGPDPQIAELVIVHAHVVGTTITINDNGRATVSGGVDDSGNTSSLTANIIYLNGGTLNGAGIVNGLIINTDGVVRPGMSPGTLTINGDYTQEAEGTLEIEIAGSNAGQFDVLAVSGLATLGGTLSVSFTNGFVPEPGQAFDILDATSTTGGFDAIQVEGAEGVSVTFAPDGTIDVIEFDDCNGNGIHDADDIAGSTSSDADADGIPDECQGIDVPADYPTIQAAIDAAGTGAQIVVAAGTYTESIDFLGKAIVVRSATGDPATTVIDAGGAGRVVTLMSGEGAATVLDGFTITGGLAGNGGGARIDGSPTVRNCIFLGNNAGNSAGAVAIQGGSPAFIDCVFSGNGAGQNGGALTVGNAALLSCTRCVFLSSTAGADGGAVYDVSVGVFYLDCSFLGNTADRGGAIYNGSDTHPLVINSLFSGNGAATGGGALYDAGAASPELRHCTFSGNTAVAGAVLYNQGSGADPVIRNSIIWGNGPTSLAFGGSGDPDITFSDVEGGFAGNGNIQVDPLFADADGIDDTIGTLDDDLRQQPGSPVIDSGSSAGQPGLSCIIADLDGHERVFDDPAEPNASGQPLDMGPYEHGAPPVAGGDCNGNGIADVCDVNPGDPDGDGQVWADADGDGMPDSCDGLPGDLDGDGTVGITDLLMLLAAWGPCGPPPAPCPEDLDGDGQVAITDLLLLLGSWGAGG